VNKSFFASFFSKKEDSSFVLRKRSKRTFISWCCINENWLLGARVAAWADAYKAEYLLVGAGEVADDGAGFLVAAFDYGRALAAAGRRNVVEDAIQIAIYCSVGA
jgi:hypothetical protein